MAEFGTNVVPSNERIDLVEYTKFMGEHTDIYFSPTHNVLSQTNYRHRFEIQWWSDKRFITFNFAKFLLSKYGPIGECSGLQFSGKPMLKFRYDEETGLVLCTDNLKIQTDCLSAYQRIIREFYDVKQIEHKEAPNG